MRGLIATTKTNALCAHTVCFFVVCLRTLEDLTRRIERAEKEAPDPKDLELAKSSKHHLIELEELVENEITRLQNELIDL